MKDMARATNTSFIDITFFVILNAFVWFFIFNAFFLELSASTEDLFVSATVLRFSPNGKKLELG